MGERIIRHPTVLLAEHGQTEFSAPGDADRIHGTKYDLPLTAEGRKQMEKTAEKLKDFPIATLEHSPMKRSTESAQIISKATGVKAVPRDGLKPWDSGFASGMTHGSAEELVRYYVKNAHKTIPDGEPYGDWWETYSKEMRDTLKRAEQTPDKVHVRAVHSSEVAAAPAIIEGNPAEVLDERLPGPGELAALEKRNGKWRFIAHFK